MSACCLCHNLRFDSPAEIWNHRLFESPNFVVVPTLGALVEGWVLLVPKRHCISMGALPASTRLEMQEVKQVICSQMRRTYGEVCAFEHGPSRPKRAVGCGVDHAHLHILPLQFDLRSAVDPFLPEDLSWIRASLDECRAASKRGQDYLYIEQPLGQGQLAFHDGFGSQLIRRAIATRLGVANEFDWRNFPQLENIRNTIRSLTTVSVVGIVPHSRIVHST